jgi:molybdate transport system regulatory protein
MTISNANESKRHAGGPPLDSGGAPLELGGEVWLRTGGGALGGASRVALLAAIRETGSINAAAKAVGMSYKAAWDAVDAMNQLAGEALVVRTTGGRGGGGTRVTPRAERLIASFAVIQAEHRRFLQRMSAGMADFAADWSTLRRISMRTSARNQLFGRVALITRGSVNDELTIALPGGEMIVAVLTHASVETLNLEPGSEAFALIKASWIMLLADPPAGGARLSARNQLAGTVAGIQRGAVNTEVAITLPGGTPLTAIITNESVARLGLAIGGAVAAVFKASSVIVGVDG